MKLRNVIDARYFFAALGFGLLYVYCVSPRPEVVVKFPSPYNAGQVTYRDPHVDTCFKFKATQVTCPSTGVRQQPMTEYFEDGKEIAAQHTRNTDDVDIGV
jgi:hypothetical protein